MVAYRDTDSNQDFHDCKPGALTLSYPNIPNYNSSFFLFVDTLFLSSLRPYST